jgi:hypothetical protein
MYFNWAQKNDRMARVQILVEGLELFSSLPHLEHICNLPRLISGIYQSFTSIPLIHPHGMVLKTEVTFIFILLFQQILRE